MDRATRGAERRVRRGAARQLRGLAAIAVVLAGSACVTTNYLDPEGPRYEASATPARDSGSCGQPDGVLKLVSFNIEYGKALTGAVALIQEDGALRDPDVLLLQEMDPESVSQIALRLSDSYVYFPGGVHHSTHRDFGSAVLSPWPLTDGAKVLLPHGAFITGLRRAATAATLRCGDADIRILSVHLTSPPALSAADREEQVRRMIAAAADHSGPVIVGGDFNSRSVGELFERAGYSWPTKDLPGTSRGMGRWWSYDHVFVRGIGVARDGPAAGVADPKGTSDHRPLWVRLQLPR